MAGLLSIGYCCPGVAGCKLDRLGARWKFTFSPGYEVHVKLRACVERTRSVQLPAEEKIAMISGSSADAKFS